MRESAHGAAGTPSPQLHTDDSVATAGVLLVTCLSPVETFLGAGKYEGCLLCLNESLCNYEELILKESM